MRWNEIYHHLEDAIDRAEADANTTEGIVLQQA